MKYDSKLIIFVVDVVKTPIQRETGRGIVITMFFGFAIFYMAVIV